MIKYLLSFIVISCLGAVNSGAYSQSYVPVPVTGFNNDVIAEAGTNAAAVTTTVIDGTQHIMYTAAFAAANGLPAGVANSGAIVYSNYTWQLAPYTGNNALYLAKDPSVTTASVGGTLTLATPATYAHISLLLFGTEGNSTYNMVLNFADGTTYNPGTFFVYDWFTPMLPVYSDYGRIERLTAPPYSATGVGVSDHSAFYKADVLVPCGSQNTPLVSITLNYLSGSGTSGRIVALALAGVSYTAPVVTPTITDATCSNSNGGISLAVSGGTTAPFSFTWNTTPVQKTPAATGLAAGVYTCTVSDVNKCPINVQGTVGTVPLAVLTAAASPAVICKGSQTSLSVSATGPAVTGYNWNPGAGTGSPVSVSPAANTIYTVSGQDANGCTVSATVAITVNDAPTSMFTVSPDTICEGSTATIQYTGNGGAGAGYDWNGFSGGVLQSGSGAGPYTVLFNTPGTVSLQLQVTDQGCPSVVSNRPLVVSEKPIPDFSTDKTEICSGDVVVVSYTGTRPGVSSASWDWGGGIVLSGKAMGPYSVRYNNPGTIELSVRNGACVVSAAPHTIAVTPKPVPAFIIEPASGCVPLEVKITNQSQNADAVTWTFSDGGSSTDVNPTHVFTKPGSYTVKLDVSNGGRCFGSLSEPDIVTVSTPPVVAFTSAPDTGVDVQVREANFVFTNGSYNAGSFLWNFGDGVSSTQSDPSHKYNKPGNYTVTLYGINGGCMDSVSHQYYRVIADKNIQIPNAFSPNGDGINDVWAIDDLKEYPDCKVSVFNRWGQELFQSTGYGRPWDGTYNGKPVPFATYYYIIILPGKKPYSGWVVLLK
jgi:gliding motility-associated-like protein